MMVVASPRNDSRGLLPVPGDMADDREHKRVLSLGVRQLQERARLHPVEIVSVSANYAMTDIDSLILVNASGAARTITLLTAKGREGREITVKKTDSSSNLVTVDAAGSETLDGSLTIELAQQYASRTWKSDGSNWHLVAAIGYTTTVG